MDKIVRNVIIFAALIIVIAAAFTVFIISRHDSPTNGVNSVTSQVAASGNDVNGANAATTGEVQDVTLSVVGGNYVITPSTLKKGIPVRMTADLNSMKGCSRSVVIASFGVRKYVQPGDNIITFTPTQTGAIRIACSMNMYTGSFTVV